MGYLQAKASNIQLPFVDPNVEFDVFTIHPTQLHMQQRLNATSTHLYFYVMKSGRNRSAGNGFWLASTGATAILNRKREVIGYRSMLVYYNNALNTNNKKRDRLAKTKWILHEYTLPEAHNMSSKGHKSKMAHAGVIPGERSAHRGSSSQMAFVAEPSSAELADSAHENATTTIELIVLRDDEDDTCIEDMENWIGNFDYCMDMIKELHDEVYDVNGNSSWRLMSAIRQARQVLEGSTFIM
ncbi:hypothetical protein Sjap_005530 [Stephania japonica]|uniref:NAC domain-containing protein n=1 Tax=Stephania japonica TaxID=461633 RepID=A0AAP0PIV5_9MAGN